VSSELIEFAARDGYRLSGRWFAAPSARAALLINGATGFPQTFYYKFAQYCAENGFDTLVYDYRGMGQSMRNPLANEPAVLSDWARHDMPAALELLANRSQASTRLTLGHSIGGQCVGMLDNHALAQAHVLVAASTGYWQWQLAPFKYLAWHFWQIHGPLMLKWRGYVPTGFGWSGLPLPRGVYLEWRKWCMRPEHFGPELQRGELPNHFAGITAPLLAVEFSDDPIATHRTVSTLLEYYSNTAQRRLRFDAKAIGLQRIGHEGFFSSRHREALWVPVVRWMRETVGIAG
jgi:predicted alpha/beta hydrolase